MLYNIKKSFAIHHIKQDQHTIYFEEYGNSRGIPVIFLHGGPGSGCNEAQKAIFDYKKYRVVFLDQRGSGKSTPKGEIKNNTTLKLVDDIEVVRRYLKIERWIVVGGSWGATLALAYGQAHTDRVEAMILRALFLGTKKEIEWAFFDAPLKFRPELIYRLNDFLNNNTLINPIFALGKMLENKNQKIRTLGASLWLAYESNLSTIQFDYNTFNEVLSNSGKKKKILPNTPFLEWHYIKNNFFLKPNQLLKHKKKLSNIKISIIQSDYDLLCPPQTSFNFASGLSNCKVIRIANAGHYISDPGVKEMMKQLLDEYEKI